MMDKRDIQWFKAFRKSIFTISIMVTYFEGFECFSDPSPVGKLSLEVLKREEYELLSTFIVFDLSL